MPLEFGTSDIEYLEPRIPYVVFEKVKLRELENEMEPSQETGNKKNQGNAKESLKSKADPK